MWASWDAYRINQQDSLSLRRGAFIYGAASYNMYFMCQPPLCRFDQISLTTSCAVPRLVLARLGTSIFTVRPSAPALRSGALFFVAADSSGDLELDTVRIRYAGLLLCSYL